MRWVLVVTSPRSPLHDLGDNVVAIHVGDVVGDGVIEIEDVRDGGGVAVDDGARDGGDVDGLHVFVPPCFVLRTLYH